MKRLALFAATLCIALAADPQAVPTLTLGKPAPGEIAPGPEGFIRRWMLLEPIPSPGLTDTAVQAAVKKEHFADQFSIVPRDGDKVQVNGSDLTWHAVETKNYNVNLFHFGRSLGKKTSDVLFWVVTVVHAPKDMPNVRLAIGSNAASVWWVNGVEVIGIYGDR